MRLFISGDLHIWNDSRVKAVQSLCRHIEEYKPDVLILSEIGDPWKAPWQTIIKTQSWKYLQRVVAGPMSIPSVPYYYVPPWQTYYLKGNHDWNAKPEYLPRAKLCHEYHIDDVLVLHGWQFDGYWNIIHPFAFWISQHRPGWMIPIYNLLYRHRTLAQMKTTHTTREDWSAAVGLMQYRARLYAWKKNVTLICGHDHCPTPYDGLFADWGDLEDSFSYITVANSVGPVGVELKYLVPEEV